MSNEPVAPDPRPRPAYGEYATPEEQRAHILRPDPALTPHAPPVVSTPPGPITFGAASGTTDGTVPRPRVVDRIVTIALLTYGLFNVLSSVPAFLDFGVYLQSLSTVLGADVTLSDPAAAKPWGTAAAIVLIVGWIGTAAISLWSLSRRRLTWWIPLTAGVVFTVISGVLVMIPLMNDPAVWNSLLDSVR